MWVWAAPWFMCLGFGGCWPYPCLIKGCVLAGAFMKLLPELITCWTA